MWTSEDQARLLSAIAANERTEVAAAVRGLVEHLRGEPNPFPAPAAKTLMQGLRRKRLFNEMLQLGEALVQQHEDVPPLVRRQYAQALIEKDELSAALAMLEALLARCADDPGEEVEVRGLIGRVHKQRYVQVRAGARPQRAPTLRAAIAAYQAVYERAPDTSTWHGINVVALAKRAERDGITLAPVIDAAAIARKILAVLNAGGDEWAGVTKSEAYLALGDLPNALRAADEWLANPQVDAFECGSFLRQLEEVWQLREDGPNGAIVALLRGALLQRQGGETRLAVDGLQSALAGAAGQDDVLEKSFGGARPQSVAWYRLALERARSVARIEDRYGSGVGTGFLVRGADLFANAALGDELVLVTNAHVLGTTYPTALRMAQAAIRFDGLGDLQRTLKVKEILFESPVADLDTTIARLEAAVPGLAPLPLAAAEPPAFERNTDRRLYVIGYPESGPLSISMEDSRQVGWKEPRLHYRTPTEPGSSGSPVFDRDWQLIGLHHAGSATMRRLEGDGFYEANEAIWIHAIRARTRGPAMVTTLESGAPIPRPMLRNGIFVSYSHKNGPWLERLRTMIAPVLRDQALDLWDDEKILPGALWEREIEKAIESAQVAVLLVTPDFLASKFISEAEFPRILEANRKRGLTIIWVAVSEALIEFTVLKHLQAANDPKRPLDSLGDADRNATLAKVARAIGDAVTLGRLKNGLTVADHIGLQSVGMGGSAAALQDLTVVARQQDEHIAVTGRAGETIETIDLADLARLPEKDGALIAAYEEAMSRAYLRYARRYPDQQAPDAVVREAARMECLALRSEVCRELNQLLDFFGSMGKRVQDHYPHVRHLCK
jgi:tetratricopeptide (TPR) repeat protein